jgi:hypothetical protein
MDKHTVELTRTELDFLRRMLLDLQQRRAGDAAAPDNDDMVAAIELALAMLGWDGAMPPELDAQVGLGAAIELKHGADALIAYRSWRSERRRRLAPLH